MKTFGRSLTFAVLMLCFASRCLAAHVCDDPPHLRFSLIPQADARKDAASFQPLLDALEKTLGKPVDVILPASYGSVVEGLMASSIDLAMLGPASYAEAKNNGADVEAFASYVRKPGVFQDQGQYYRSFLIVRSDSNFQTVEALRGTALALVDPASTSGAVLPRHLFPALVKAPLEQFFGRVVYTGGHDKSAEAIMNGSVDAAFVASSMLSDFITSGRASKTDFRVLWQSEPIPHNPFVYRGQLCAPIRDKIRAVFFASDGAEFRAMLDKQNQTRFAPISDDNYKLIREILREP